MYLYFYINPDQHLIRLDFEKGCYSYHNGSGVCETTINLNIPQALFAIWHYISESNILGFEFSDLTGRIAWLKHLR